jgi:hypothetical protein
MEINTINVIRTKRDSIREKIKSLNIKNNKTTYGPENEYTYKGLLAGIEALLTDISALTGAPNKFIKLSTHQERNQIVSNLTYIDQYIQSPQNFIAHFEALKVMLRSYNVRSMTERQIEFENEIEKVRKTKIQLDQTLTESEKLLNNINSKTNEHNESIEDGESKLEEINSQLQLVNDRKEKLEQEVDNLQTLNTTLSEIKETANENLEKINDSLNESKSNEKLISSFANNIQKSNTQLTVLQQNTEDNNEQLKEYEVERKRILSQATDLINSAKKALNYKSAEGISASFQNQYDSSNNKILLGSWIVGAILCLLSTIGLGLWILQTNPDYLGLLIGRISLLPLPVIGAVFCANQYTKQKNIIEDYAYKMVLSKNIVGFSEQLKKNGSEDNVEYVHYIKTALEEIHRDPLRKREGISKIKAQNTNINDIVELAEKIVKMSKP